jgi:hypothetical protein
MGRRKTREEFIEQAQAKHGKNSFNYSKVVYKNTMTKVTIICSNGHEFNQRPNDHLKGDKCAECNGTKKLTTEDFIRKANLKHKNKYTYKNTVYTGSYNKVIITCPIHFDFEQSSQGHLHGTGCPRCQGRYKTNEDFVKEAKDVHGDKYSYEFTNYISTKEKVIIYCYTHGKFSQKPNSHTIQKQGCAKCSKNAKLNTETFIAKASELHNNKYDYSLVNYVNATTKIKIICPKHKLFEIIPVSHLQKQGCRQCGNERKATSHTYDLKEFIRLSRNIHGERYDYSKVIYKNAKEKVIIICKEIGHGKFKQTPQAHFNKGNGCPLCNNTSIGETVITDYLKSKNIKFIPEKTFEDCIYVNKLRFDFYLPRYNLAIEFDGRQHFEPVEKFGGLKEFKLTKARDKVKNNYCRDNNIDLLRISYKDIHKTRNILKDYLNDK